LDELNRRISNYETRGIARRPDQSFEDLFAERKALYERYADIVVDCNGLDQTQALAFVIESLT